MNEPRLAALLGRAASILALCLLGSCGIDQGGGLITTPATGPSALVVVGPITGFGSVHVNGLTLETAATEILLDGTPVPQSALKEGQIIRAVAAVTPTSINATTIEYRQNVRGPIGQIDAAAGTLTVLGQSVRTDARTVLDIGGRALGELVATDVVEISGLRLATGALQATYLGAAAPTDSFTLTTAITATDVNNLTFDLGALPVDYSQVLLLDVPTGIPNVGLVVRVEGVALGPNGELIVDQINSLPTAPGAFRASDTVAAVGAAAVGTTETREFRANVHSLITAANLPMSITLGDVEVGITALTRVANGIIDELQPGRLVQVEGEVVSAGIIQADRIELL